MLKTRFVACRAAHATRFILLCLVVLAVIPADARAATISYGQLTAGRELAITNPTATSLQVSLRIPPQLFAAERAPLVVTIAAGQTHTIPNAIASLGDNALNAVVEVIADQDVRLSVPELAPIYPGEAPTLDALHDPTASRTGTLVLTFTGEVRVSAVTRTGGVVATRLYSTPGDSRTLRIPYADLLGQSPFSGVLRVEPTRGVSVAYLDGPVGRRRAVRVPAGTAPVALLVSGASCVNQTGLRIAAPQTAGATYRWTLRNASAPSITGSTIDVLPLRAGEFTAELAMTVGTITSFGIIHIPVNAKPEISSLSAPDGTENRALTIRWTVEGFPTSATITGTDFGNGVTVNPAIGEYTYTPTATGSKSATLTVASDCGGGGMSTNYTVFSDCGGFSTSISAPSTIEPNGTGTATANPGAASYSSTISNYSWSISNGTITSGQGTRSIGFTAGGSGTVRLGVTATSSTGCSASDTHDVSIVAPAPVINSFTADSYVVPYDGTTTLRFTIENAASWSFNSSKGNAVTPRTGTGSGSFTVRYDRIIAVGADTVTLTVTGTNGNTVQQSIVIN